MKKGEKKIFYFISFFVIRYVEKKIGDQLSMFIARIYCEKKKNVEKYYY